MIKILHIDKHKLDYEIQLYIAATGRNPYIICSEETEDIMIKALDYISSQAYCDNITALKKNHPNEKLITMYCGCKLLIDNSLKLGEIEIR